MAVTGASHAAKSRLGEIKRSNGQPLPGGFEKRLLVLWIS
jgi:hypothetical protein